MTACRLEPCIQLPLSEEKLRESVDKAKDWTLMHGNLTDIDNNQVTCRTRDTQVTSGCFYYFLELAIKIWRGYKIIINII